MPYTPSETHEVHGGQQRKYKFPNGYGASVVRHQYSYGHADGLWELAVLGPDGHITYDTPITGDVEGWLTDQDVDDFLARIEDLPAVES